jgi:hypothetical protein
LGGRVFWRAKEAGEVYHTMYAAGAKYREAANDLPTNLQLSRHRPGLFIVEK